MFNVMLFSFADNSGNVSYEKLEQILEEKDVTPKVIIIN